MTKEEAINKVRQMNLPKETMEILQALAPDLRESEDERVRKAIIKSIKEDSSVYEQEVSKEQMLAYLEKQKEASKAIEAVERIDKYIDEHLANAHDMKDSNPEKKYYRGWDDALGKMAGILQDVYSEEKQKEDEGYEAIPVGSTLAQTSEEKEYIRTLKSLISDFIRDKQPEDVAFYQKIYDWLDGRHVEQKHPNGCFTCDEYKKGYEEGRRNGFTAGYNKAMKEQKPAEWSEEDAGLIDLAVAAIEDFYDKSNPIRSKIINWLKSLRPSWKPTYEQMEALRKAVNKLADTEVADSVRLSIMYDHLKELM